MISKRAFALVSALSLAAGSCTVDLGEAPFLCTPEAPACPEGYHCDSRNCVRNDLHYPTPLVTTIADDETSFSVRPRAATGDILVCWRQALSARDPGIHGAVISSTGEVTRAATPLYSGDSSSLALISDVAGDCAIENGQTVVATTRLAGTENYLLRMFLVNFEDESTRNPANEMFHRHGFNYYSMTNVDDEVWLVDSRNTTAGNDVRVLYVSRVNSQFSMTSTKLPLPPLSTDRDFVSVESVGGTGGAWISAIFRDNSVELAWMPTTLDTLHYIVQPVTQHEGAFILAVRGQEAAVAYHLTEDTWQIYWIAPAANDPADPLHSGSTARPGPTITLDPDVLRPGAVADGDRLVFVGAVDAQHVDAWSTPWGSSQPFQSLERITKLSHVVPRRLKVTSVGGHLVAVWTERVPASANGTAEYNLLAASALSTPAQAH